MNFFVKLKIILTIIINDHKPLIKKAHSSHCLCLEYVKFMSKYEKDSFFLAFFKK